MVEPYKQEVILKKIDDVMRTYERIGDSDIPIRELVSSIGISISNIVRHSTVNPQKNVQYQRLYEFLLSWQKEIILC
ncbi:hypothetical protein CAEBREN_11624 [Caenorhabditis brenneri]|uniref:Uncharacterized protein n=1 Tax=Caenorhabditis brenneri TaxID=135651 RepID=G0NNS6_CAEBE|nr:hypothetical protein CAEBREN_11624 [Caenorhabditis brenneri]